MVNDLNIILKKRKLHCTEVELSQKGYILVVFSCQNIQVIPKMTTKVRNGGEIEIFFTILRFSQTEFQT